MENAIDIVSLEREFDAANDGLKQAVAQIGSNVQFDVSCARQRMLAAHARLVDAYAAVHGGLLDDEARHISYDASAAVNFAFVGRTFGVVGPIDLTTEDAKASLCAQAVAAALCVTGEELAMTVEDCLVDGR